FVGKFLNEYDGRAPVPGWDVWDPILTNWYSYYGTTFFAPRPHDRTTYSTDAISDRTADYLRQLAAGPTPFFLWVSHVAPHSTPNGRPSWGPPRVAPRDAHALQGVPASSRRSPSYEVPAPRGAGLAGGSGSFRARF